MEKDPGSRRPLRSGRPAPSGGAARLVLLAFVLLLPACGPKRPAEVRTEPPPPPEAAVDPDAAPERATPVDPGAGTPRREASEHLVRQGVEELEAGRSAVAARRLEEAIRVDGSNGLAYYHLARVRLEAGRTNEARGLLDRAVELLRPYPERRAEAESLRSRL